MENSNRTKAGAGFLILAVVLCAVLVIISSRGSDERIIPADSARETVPARNEGQAHSGQEPAEGGESNRLPEETKAGMGEPSQGFRKKPADTVVAPCGMKEGGGTPVQGLSSIRGKVTFNRILPLEGVEVHLLHHVDATKPIRTASSDENGRFEFKDVASGEYLVKASRTERAKAFTTDVQAEVVISGDGTDRIVNLCFRSEPEKLPCRVFGKVTWAGEPVGRVKISFGDGGKFLSSEEVEDGEENGSVEESETVTGDDGTYEIKRLSPGIRLFSILSARFEIGIPEAAEFELNFTMPSASAAGRVYDAATKKPIPNAVVLFRWGYSECNLGASSGYLTDKDGRYSMSGISGGTYAFLVYAKGYLRFVKEDVRILDGRENSGIDLFVSRGCAIEGAVFDPDGKPLAGAALCLEIHLANSMRTQNVNLDERGAFRVQGLEENTVDVRLITRDFAPCRAAAVHLVDGADARLEFRLSRGGSIRIRADDSSGEPKAGVMFGLAYEDGECMSIGMGNDAKIDKIRKFNTGADGTCTVLRVPPGRVVIKCRDTDGSDFPDETVSVAEGGVVEKRYAVK